VTFIILYTLFLYYKFLPFVLLFFSVQQSRGFGFCFEALIISNFLYTICNMLQTFKKATVAALEEIVEEKKVRKTNELFLLFSMGSQFDHLLKQKLDALGVFCLVADPASVVADDVTKVKPTGIIL